ncbi:hypothetical protein PybrP1_011020 [[Pythium] brassicae (nom. inval.)]|nr:hypothetical protein PybrP1_011020 [[Pythium] brassicae (nom. inval.)]
MRVLATLAAFALACTAAAATERDAAACRALGFDADTLDCRRCDELAAALAPSSAASTLTSECRDCCTDVAALAAATGDRRHARVVLEVCTCKFGRYPKVANFVHHHAAKHAKLSVEYINARHPFLIFYDDEGNKQEEISIAGWDEDTINEFIVAKIVPDEAADEAGEAAAATSAEDVVEEDDDAEPLAAARETDEL